MTVFKEKTRTTTTTKNKTKQNKKNVPKTLVLINRLEQGQNLTIVKYNKSFLFSSKAELLDSLFPQFSKTHGGLDKG